MGSICTRINAYIYMEMNIKIVKKLEAGCWATGSKITKSSRFEPWPNQ